MGEDESPRGIKGDPIVHPPAYWVIKGLAVIAVVVLAVFDLSNAEAIPSIVYMLLALLAAGPEVASAFIQGVRKE